MEKEFQIQHSKLELSYLGDEFTGLQSALSSLANIFSDFLTDDLEQSSFSAIFLNVTLCSSDKIKELNSDYRNKESETDVLSFPVQDNIRNGEVDTFSPELELGDIFICKSVCQSQAEEFSIGFRDEFLHLAVHGFLHLCGYDHELSSEEEKLMERLEEKLIHNISSLK